MINQDLINSFDRCLRKYADYAYPFYNAPVDNGEIDFYMKKLGFPDDGSQSDYKTLYQWKNGIDMDNQDYSVDVGIISAGNFVSLKDALTIHQDNLKHLYGPLPHNTRDILQRDNRF